MNHLVVMAAGLGWEWLKRRRAVRLDDLAFRSAKGVFPAVTCVAQAALRTGAEVGSHGMVANGLYMRNLRRPLFWEQSSALVEGPRIWDGARARGEKVGMYFFQQSMGESVDSIISPAPIHKHGGGMVMSSYTQPPECAGTIEKKLGAFPLIRYWGPFASPKVGRRVVADFREMIALRDVDTAFLYLPTLDYNLQRHGPDSLSARSSLRELWRQLRELRALASAANAEFTVIGDYEIAPVTEPCVNPNLALRSAGYFKVRKIGEAAYPDFNASSAFAMCDHEIAHVYVRDGSDVERVARLFSESGRYESVEIRSSQSWASANAGEILLLAKRGSWCAYPWWTDRREAPDWATHVDIHNKPGFDPCELFLDKWYLPRTCQNPARVKGTHGRPCEIAWASTNPSVGGESLVEIARSLFQDGKGAVADA